LEPPSPPVPEIVVPIPISGRLRVPIKEEKECPFCGESILAVAKKCKHCGETIDVVLRAAEEAARAAQRPNPPRVVVQSSASASATVVQKVKSPSCLSGCLGLVFLCFLAWCLISGLAGLLSPPPDTKKSERRPGHGETGVIYIPGHDDVDVAIDAKAHDEWISAAVAKDEAGITELILSGRVLIMPARTRVLVLAPGVLSTEVRILDGPYAGRKGITSSEWVHSAHDDSRPRSASPKPKTAKDEGEAPLPDRGKAPPTPAKSEKGPVRQDDVQVRIAEVSIGKVPLKTIGRDTTSKKDLLMVRLELLNINPTEKVEYHSWASRDILFDRDCPTLKDNFGNSCKWVSFGRGTRPAGTVEGSKSIYPNKPVSDVLVFEVPRDTATHVDLELPATNFGGEGMLRFRIPMKSVVEQHRAAEARAREEETGRRAEEAAEKAMERAPGLLEKAKQFLKDGKAAVARGEHDEALGLFQTATEHCRQILKSAPQAPAAAEANALSEEAKKLMEQEKAEVDAAVKLGLAKRLDWSRQKDRIRERLEEIVRRFPGTQAAAEAKALLDKLGRTR
jgi:hypothetical protein